MSKHRTYSVSVSSEYSHYLSKAEEKGRTKAEVDETICRLTGYCQETLANYGFGAFRAAAPDHCPDPIR